MGESVFIIIHRNQTLLSSAVAIILSIGTLVVTVFLSRELSNYEMVMKYTIYRAGYDDAYSLRLPIQSSKLLSEEKLFIELDRIYGILKITCGMGFLASVLHLLSSGWTLYKRSPTSIKLWLLAQSIAVAALVTAIILPISYKLKAVFLLSCFYAILSVDIFITLLLLTVVFIDQRSASQSNDGLLSQMNEDIMEGNKDIESTVSVTAEGSSSSLDPAPAEVRLPTPTPGSGDEALPPPPPPPT